MKQLFSLVLAAFAGFSVSAQILDRITDPVEWVTALMGTDSKQSLSNGTTYPAIGVPWEMNCWTPQTGNIV